MNPQPHTCRQRFPSAFTLIEMVVSLSVISIVFLAMGSVMVLASKALPSADTVSIRAFDATELIHRLTSELETAKTLTV
jgi:prepilin-type N-terminal cleavage/methylation domain-containing protein